MAAKTSKTDNILNMFDRPTEPAFWPKGDKSVIYEVPADYLTERYKPLEPVLASRFKEGERVAVRKITLPDLSLPARLGQRENFSLFIPYHRRMAGRLIEVFMGMRDLDDLLSASVYCQLHMNPYMYIYCLSVAILHRPDTKNIDIPSLSTIFPAKYVDSSVLSRAREEANVVEDSESREPLELPLDWTASNLEEEHRVAYFREDLGINLHHWHWHLVYPFDGPRDIVTKDRRGELFYYMHQQILARYNAERFSNNLARVKRFLNFREPLPEGYFPKLDSLVSSRSWPPRTANTRLSDINREVDQLKFDIQDLERWRDRIYQSIHSGFVVNDSGANVPLSETNGIDILGNIMEASILSINKNLYGDIHNFGHLAISLSHDPDHRNLETFGVMGDSATAMRDPVFYRWHAFVDDVFQEHKNTLPRYTVQQLEYSGVRITSVEINSQGRPKNEFATFWQKNDVDLSRGLDFTPRGPVYARFTHLQHAPFSYKIHVDNNGNARMGTVRIFLAPKFDERGLPMLFRDQKHLFIELDKFQFNLTGKKATIERRSTQASTTIPFERTFRNLDDDRPVAGSPLEQFNFCGCGWPQHMLIPKGTPDGLPCQLFVMISNFADDKVDKAVAGNRNCDDAASYCGVRDSVFPDRRSMGYPFDRAPRSGVETLSQFLTSNMAVQDCIIRFTGQTQVPKKAGAPKKG